MRLSTLIGVSCLVLAACRPAWRHEPFRAEEIPSGLAASEDGVDPSKDAVPRIETSPARQRLLAQMKGHYEIVAELEQAVIDGDLDALAERAGVFADAPALEGGPGADHVRRMKAAARDAAAAPDLVRATAAVTTMASVCGDCHVALDVVPALPPLPALDRGDTPKAAMRRHAWAVDRMWEGLVVPSEERWIQGTALFTAVPGCDPGGEPHDRDERQTLCHRVRALAQRAHVTQGWPERIDIHARVLGTCAACHDAAR